MKLSAPSVCFSPKCLPALPTHAIQVITSCSITHHQPTHSSPIVVHVTEMHCYALLDCLHSPCWPPSRTCCSSALILLVGQHLVPVTRPASFTSLTYLSYWLLICGHSFRWPTSRTRCSFAVILLAGLHLVRVARLSSIAGLAYSYALLVCPHSPRWPTAPTHCSFDLVFADLRSDVWQKHRVRHHWPTSHTCCSFVLIRRAGLLVCVACLPSFSLLANIS